MTLKPTDGGKTGGLIVVLAVVIGAIYWWLGPGTGAPATVREGTIYYPALAEAFGAGQLHLKQAPDPRLAALEKPWQVLPDGIPRLPESVYHDGKYYLYFGALPALLLFLPSKLLFGVYPTDDTGILIFSTLACAVGVGLLWWGWRRWFTRLSVGWLGLTVLIWAFCTRSIFMLQYQLPHGVPIAAAFFCTMLALASAAWALGQSRPVRRCVGLALVSLAWGAAVSCRPNLIFGLPAVAVVAWGLYERDKSEGARRRRIPWLLIGATVLPAALVGVAMMAYNQARFGHVADFGVRYHVGVIETEGVMLFGWENIVPNWQLFVLSLPSAPRFSAYFPFFPGWFDYWGIFWATPMVALGLGLPWAIRWWRGAGDRVWSTLMLTMAVAAVLNALSIFMVTLVVGVAERYVVDFLPYGLLVAMLTALAGLDATREAKSTWRRLVQGVVLVAGLVSVAHAGLTLLVRSHPTERLPGLARASNTVVGWLEKWQDVQYGPMRMKVRFRDHVVGAREPLVVSGNGRDRLFVEYLAAGRIKLGLDHRGTRPLESDPIEVVPGREYEIGLDLGNLYPPPEHPFFDGVDFRVAQALRHRLLIHVDGVKVLEMGCNYYPTQPGDLFIGRDGTDVGLRFSGEIRRIEREGLPAVAALTGPELGNPVRLTVSLPPFRGDHREPLVSTGPWRSGNVVYVAYVGPNQIRLGHDVKGGGAVESELLSYQPNQKTTIDISLPSLAGQAEVATMGRLVVRFDRRIVLDEKVWVQPSRGYEVFPGFNGADSSVVAGFFQGRLWRADSLRRPMVVPLAAAEPATGAIGLTVKFPRRAAGTREPLLVAGRTGAADAVFVEYLDDTHIRFGHDHWGQAETWSLPVPVDLAATHAVEISLGSLYPPVEDEQFWAGIPPEERGAKLSGLRVRLNGEEIMATAPELYPVGVGEVAIGRNAIGLSSCEAAFTGWMAETYLAGPGSTR